MLTNFVYTLTKIEFLKITFILKLLSLLNIIERVTKKYAFPLKKFLISNVKKNINGHSR